MSLFSSLNVALSGLQTTQNLLNTTTRNISNAQTTGYVRETQQAITNVTGGGGVLAGAVQRQVDLTLLNQQWANNAATNYNSTQSALLSQLDDLNGNPSAETSLSAQITALGNAFQQLSSNPTDPASATAVIAAAQNLALTFNEQTATVQNLASTATQNISNNVTNVNTDLQKIASLNQQIVNGKALGQNVGELQDELNDTVTDLSQYMTVNTFYDNQGYLNVYSGNYAPLASNYAEVVSYKRYQYRRAARGRAADRWHQSGRRQRQYGDLPDPVERYRGAIDEWLERDRPAIYRQRHERFEGCDQRVGHQQSLCR